MVTLTNTSKPVMLVKANPTRTGLKIGLLSDTSLYLRKDGRVDSFSTDAFVIKLNGVFELDGVHCYKGAIYAIVSASSDVRVWET